ncbi:MAG: DUF6286 domain-containing protein [Micrococcaceae bacterium]
MKHLHRRPSRTVPALLAVVVVLVLAALALWSGLTVLLTGAWPVAAENVLQSLGATSWSSPTGWAVAVGCAVLGLVLLLCALIPGARNAAPLRTPEPGESARDGVDALLLSQGMATLASAVAAQVDGVAGVRTSAAPRSVFVTVTTPLRDTEALVAEVREQVEHRLAGTGLVRAPRVRVTAQVKEAS